MIWNFNKAWQKNHQTVYRRIDPSVRRRQKIRKRVLWAVAGLLFYIFAIVFIDRIVFLFGPDISATSVFSAQLDGSNPTPLISNAFKLGNGLTQLRYAATNELNRIKWRNRAVVHLAALGIDYSVIQEAIDDSILTLDEMMILRDRIREKMVRLHGTKVASTFVAGVELIPVTRAFELYLRDSEYRDNLAKSDVSIFQLGSLLNSNLKEAVLPNDLKINLVTAYTQTHAKETSPEELIDQIKRFREGILNYFYRNKDDISSAELLSASDRFSNSLQN